jgi:hypothetical protein
MNTNSKVALAVTADAALGLGSISAGHRFPPPWSVEEQDGETRADYLRLLSELPTDLPTKLFANANRVRLAAGDILFRAGAAADGCYRVEDGLLKVSMVSGSGAERILSRLGCRVRQP